MSDASTDSQSKPGEPRSLRFTFNSNSTSSKPPDDIIQEVISASTKHGIAYALISRYLLECTANVGGGETVKLEVEVRKTIHALFSSFCMLTFFSSSLFYINYNNYNRFANSLGSRIYTV